MRDYSTSSIPVLIEEIQRLNRDESAARHERLVVERELARKRIAALTVGDWVAERYGLAHVLKSTSPEEAIATSLCGKRFQPIQPVLTDDGGRCGSCLRILARIERDGKKEAKDRG